MWYSRVLFETAHFRNKCQVNLFLFQWFGPVFLSSNSPKVGIGSNRSNIHISSFQKFVQVLWIIDQHCNKIIEHASNKYVSAAYCWLQNFNKKLLKERNLLEIFVKEQCFEKKCFDNKTWKEFSLAMDRPMFPNMRKTFCNLETRNMKFNRCLFKCFHWVMLAFWQIDMCKDWKNQLSAAPSACDFQKVYLRSILAATTVR